MNTHTCNGGIRMRCCCTSITCRFVAALESWLTQSFHGWLDMFTTPTARAATPTLSPQHVQARLYHTLCRLRIDELFDIIVDYPDSHAAITDLQTCLQRIADTSGYPVDNSGYLNPRTYLLQSLTATFRRRLLHPGANTNDILTQYILAIKVCMVEVRDAAHVYCSCGRYGGRRQCVICARVVRVGGLSGRDTAYLCCMSLSAVRVGGMADRVTEYLCCVPLTVVRMGDGDRHCGSWIRRASCWR